MRSQPRKRLTEAHNPPQRFVIGTNSSSGRTNCGASFNNRVRSWSDSRTRSNSPYSRYRSPPWISRDEQAVVPELTSAVSTTHTDTPLSSSSRAIAAPLMPAPRMRTGFSEASTPPNIPNPTCPASRTWGSAALEPFLAKVERPLEIMDARTNPLQAGVQS